MTVGRLKVYKMCGDARKYFVLRCDECGFECTDIRRSWDSACPECEIEDNKEKSHV